MGLGEMAKVRGWYMFYHYCYYGCWKLQLGNKNLIHQSCYSAKVRGWYVLPLLLLWMFLHSSC